MTPKMYKEAHKSLGCPGCRYCDERALFKRPCCTYPGLIETDYDTHKCLTRKEKEGINPKFFIKRTHTDEPEMDYQKTVGLAEAIEIFPFLKSVFERKDFSLLILRYETDAYQIVRLS